jgi:hypothetical protein
LDVGIRSQQAQEPTKRRDAEAPGIAAAQEAEGGSDAGARGSTAERAGCGVALKRLRSGRGLPEVAAHEVRVVLQFAQRQILFEIVTVDAPLDG